MAAYAFARLRWPGRNLVFGLFLTAMLVPPIFTSLPNFVLIKNLGLLNTFPGLILPTFFMTPFAVFFMRQFFLGINRGRASCSSSSSDVGRPGWRWALRDAQSASAGAQPHDSRTTRVAE